jgi:F0F1-type ATP synthase gamma subunit
MQNVRAIVNNYLKRRLYQKILKAVDALNEARMSGTWAEQEAAEDKLHALYVRHPQIVEHYI